MSDSPRLTAAARRFRLDPPLPVALAGWGIQPNAARQDGPLEFNLLLLGVGDDLVALVTADLLYPGGDLRSAAERAVAGRLPSQNLLLAASHTHNAPATDRSKPDLGRVDPELLVSLGALLERQLGALLDSPTLDVELHVHSFQVDHSVNRRLRRLRVMQEGLVNRGISYGFNPSGPRDETVTVLVVGEQTRPVAVLWNYACHPTAFPDHGALSPDYPGVVRDAIRREYGMPELPVLFLQGFSGDTRPPTPFRPRSGRDWVKRALWGPIFGDFDAEGYRTWTDSLARAVVTGIKTGGVRMTPTDVRTARREPPRSAFVLDEQVNADAVAFQAVSLGDLTIVGVAAEVVSSFAGFVRERSATQFTMPTGCLDTPVGYIATEDQLVEGGYEAGGFCRAFSLSGVAPEIARVTRSHLAALLTSVEADGGTAAPASAGPLDLAGHPGADPFPSQNEGVEVE